MILEVSMKIARLLLALVFVVAAVGSFTGTVSAAKFPSYTSGIQIQNLSSGLATVSLKFFNTDGTLRETVAVSGGIPGNQSVTYAALPLTSTEPFNGSVVITSDVPVAAISNIARSEGTARGSYIGSESGSTTVTLPLLQKNNGSRQWTSWFSVQSTTTDATVNVDYTDCSGTVDASKPVKASSSVVFDQAEETCHTTAFFGATVTSTVPLVVVVIQESSVANSLLAYTGFNTSGTTHPVVPLVNANNNGWQTGIQMLNSSGQSTVVKLTYVDAGTGSTCTETQTIDAGKTAVYALSAFVNGSSSTITTDCKGKRVVGAAFIANASDNSTNANLLAVVNQTKAIGTSNLAGSYGAFDAAQATSKVVFPLIMDRRGGTMWRTGFNVMNVGGAATFVKCTFTNSSVVVQQKVEVNAALNHNQQNAIANNYVGSATCQAFTDATYQTPDTAAKIVGVANESGTGTGDLLLTYEGISAQ